MSSDRRWISCRHTTELFTARGLESIRTGDRCVYGSNVLSALIFITSADMTVNRS